MSPHFTIYILPLLVAAAVSGALAIAALRHRTASRMLARAFASLMIACAVWLVAYALEIDREGLETKLFWSNIRYIGIVATPVTWFLITAAFTGRERWLRLRNLVVLAIIPTLTLYFKWTNGEQGLMWSSVWLEKLDQIVLLNSTFGFWFWVHSAYSYILMLAGAITLASFFLRSRAAYRRQLFAMLIAVVSPWIANAISLLGLSVIDITPYAFTITGIMMAWAMFRLNLLDVVPIARNLVIESIEDAMIVLDAHNRVIDFNVAAQHVFAQDKRALIGQSVYKLMARLPSPLTNLRSEEFVFWEGDNQRIFELSASTLYARSRTVIGRVIILRDITKRKWAEAQIRQQNEQLRKANQELEIARQKAEESTRLKSHFLATMSHELRTPLSAIIGYSEIQLAGMAGTLNEEQAGYQNRILSNAEHLLNLINQILDLSKIEAGRVELTNAPFKVAEWLELAANQVHSLADRKGLRLDVVLDKDLPAFILGDANRLKQIALNLLANAIKFTENGFVQIEVGRYSVDRWKIEVLDTGIGIDPEHHETIFEEFRQADGTSSREHGGTGLGLAIVRRLAALMGGSVRLQSTPGQGSRFSVYLPLTAVSEEIAINAKSAPVGLMVDGGSNGTH